MVCCNYLNTAGNCDTNSITKNIADIASAIELSLDLIATLAYAKGIITRGEWIYTTDSTAPESEIWTDVVFNDVRATITNDPTKIEEVKAVFNNMGEPISRIVSELERCKFTLNLYIHNGLLHK